MSYELQIVSQHPDFKGKNLKKYKVDDEEVVGAWHEEPFEVVFKNNSWQKVQVKISIDGTDVLTGELADTTISDKMWVVEPRSELRLKAWPETNEGGAQFVFTHAEQSVAVHTHGDLSSRGIIAAAVYTEGYVHPGYYIKTGYDPYRYGSLSGTILRSFMSNDYRSSDVVFGSCLNDTTASNSLSCDMGNTPQEMKSLASVGAGQQISQEIRKAQGLREPKFDKIVKVKYSWWSDLVPRLEQGFVKSVSGSGFPGDKKQLMSIGSTPRIGDTPRADPQKTFDRF